MQKIKLINGRIHHVDGKNLFLSKNNKILISNDLGQNWNILINIPIPFFKKLLLFYHPIARLFRMGVHHFLINENHGVVAFNNEFYFFHNGNIKKIGKIKGSRPLVTSFDNSGNFLYGEYKSNKERKKINIHCYNVKNETWSVKWTFDNIRHVHGIFYDKYSDSIWVTTGDLDSESSIWNTNDNFHSLNKICGGNQQLRCIQLLFNKNYVYFGSDAPDEDNFIYRMSRNNWKIEKLCKVSGPVFYGISNKENLFFSTSVEPGHLGNDQSETWHSKDGINWKMIYSVKKDFLSMKFFQYGQTFFPSKIINSKLLFITPFATKKHGKSIMIDFGNN